MSKMKRQVLPWRLMRILRPWVMFWAGRLPFLARTVLVLETIGRTSGLPRRTPLQYELIEGDYYIGAARGEQADWYRNLQKNAGVRLRIGRDWMSGTAEPVTEVSEKAAYLHTRLERHPRMVGRMLRLHGVSGNPQPEDIVRVAAEIALVRVTQIATGA